MPTIVVNVNGKNITVAPTRLFRKSGLGLEQVVWKAPGNSAEITNLEFDDPLAPIENLRRQPGGDWEGDWNTDVASTIWKYSVSISVGGDPLPVLDPEIENGPPGGVDPDEDDGPGGGG